MAKWCHEAYMLNKQNITYLKMIEKCERVDFENDIDIIVNN